MRIAPEEFDLPEDVASAAAGAKHHAKRSNAGLYVRENKDPAAALYQDITINARRSALA